MTASPTRCDSAAPRARAANPTGATGYSSGLLEQLRVRCRLPSPAGDRRRQEDSMRPKWRSTLARLAIILAAVSSPAAARAQTISLDEGAFRIIMGGREVGRETFVIRQSGSGSGAVIIAQGRVVLDTIGGAAELSPSLEVVGASLRPAAYQVEVRGPDAQRIAGRLVGGRFSARIVSAAGEQMREYLASDGAVLLDETIAHHYYFLARRLDGAPFRVPVIIPRQSRQVSAGVTPRGTENIVIGGERVQARRMSVEPASGAVRHVWVESQGRVLRVEIPARGYVAERTAGPR